MTSQLPGFHDFPLSYDGFDASPQSQCMEVGKYESTGLIQAVLHDKYAVGMKAQFHKMQGFFDIERVKMEVVHIDRAVVHILLYDYFIFHDI